MKAKRGWVFALLLAGSCSGQDGGGRAAGDPGAGGKADATNTSDPNRSAHWNAVAACRFSAAEAPDDDPLAVQHELLACVSDVNDEVWPSLLRDLPDEIRDEYSGELTETTADAIDRHVGRLRASQEQACAVLAVVFSDDDEDDAELAMATCMAQSELHTANLIDAHVDLGFPRLEVRTITERHRRCIRRFDHAVDSGPPDPLDDPLLSEEEWSTAIRHELRDCIKSEDAELRIGWTDALGTNGEHAGESFSTRLRVVTSGMERESRASKLLCELFGQTESGDSNLVAAQCMVDATMQAGTLVDILSLAFIDEPDDDKPDDDEPGDKPKPPVPTPDEGEACYPGPDRDYSVCIPLAYPATAFAGYTYPAPLGGSANYRRPVGFIDLDTVDMGLKVSADFTLGEFAQRHKGRYALVQPHAVASLQRIRDEVGSISLNSGYRSPDYNNSVGGAGHSRHMFGDGFDLDPNEVALDTLEDACQQGGGFLVEYTSHVHCDFRFANVDPAFFGPKP